MARQKSHSPEQTEELLRQIEEGIANRKTIAESCMRVRSPSRCTLEGAISAAMRRTAKYSDSENWSRRARI